MFENAEQIYGQEMNQECNPRFSYFNHKGMYH